MALARAVGSSSGAMMLPSDRADLPDIETRPRYMAPI